MVNMYSLEEKTLIYCLFMTNKKSVHKAKKEYMKLKNVSKEHVPSTTTVRRIISAMDKKGHLTVGNSSTTQIDALKKTPDPRKSKSKRVTARVAALRTVSKLPIAKSKPLGFKTAFGLFVDICFDTHRTNFPEIRVTRDELSTRCAEHWKTMEPGDKKAFQVMADAEQARLEKEMRE